MSPEKLAHNIVRDNLLCKYWNSRNSGPDGIGTNFTVSSSLHPDTLLWYQSVGRSIRYVNNSCIRFGLRTEPAGHVFQIIWSIIHPTIDVGWPSRRPISVTTSNHRLERSSFAACPERNLYTHTHTHTHVSARVDSSNFEWLLPTSNHVPPPDVIFSYHCPFICFLFFHFPSFTRNYINFIFVIFLPGIIPCHMSYRR